MSKNKSKRKKTYQKRSNVKQNSSPVTWLMGGIFIGLFIAGIFYVKYHSNNHPIVAKSSPKFTSLKEIATEEAPKHTHHSVAHSNSKAKNNESLPHSEHHIAKSSQYEFYNLLSSQEENIPSPKKQEEPPKILTYSLEIGKFKSFSEADQLKAQLILLGVDHIDVTKNLKEHNFKVVAGPFISKAEANKVQKQLKDNAISCTLNIH